MYSDYGYEHADGFEGKCVRDSSVTLPDQCADNAQTYLQSSGYVRDTVLNYVSINNAL